MDILEKCRKFYLDSNYAISLGYPASPRMAQALGLYPFFIPIDQNEGAEAIIDGKRFVMIGSNNYLGLTIHPKVRAAATTAIEKYGTACTGSRFLNGTLHLHLELEERLAAFLGKESALVFSTGYQTNLGTMTALLGKEDIVILDKEVHASVLDGVFLAKGYKNIESRFFRHNDMNSLEDILKSYPAKRGKLVAVDGVFSMSGDIAPLPDIVALCKKHGARLMVDDAHAIGVLGKGRGTPHHFGCVDDVDLVVGTFSKALASIGGFVAGRKETIHWIQHVARSLIFSASLPPSNVAAVIAALEIIEEEPERIVHVNAIAERVRLALADMGFDIGASQTPIIPILIGDQFRTMQAWDMLFRAGIYTNVALPPAVSSQRALLRTSYTALHTNEHVDRVLACFSDMRERIPSTTKHAKTKKGVNMNAHH